MMQIDVVPVLPHGGDRKPAVHAYITQHQVVVGVVQTTNTGTQGRSCSVQGLPETSPLKIRHLGGDLHHEKLLAVKTGGEGMMSIKVLRQKEGKVKVAIQD